MPDTLQILIDRTQSTLDSLKTAISSINSTPNEEAGSMLSEWLNIPIKIFGYSSIQVKVFASITALIIFFIIKKIIQKYNSGVFLNKLLANFFCFYQISRFYY